MKKYIISWAICCYPYHFLSLYHSYGWVFKFSILLSSSNTPCPKSLPLLHLLIYLILHILHVHISMDLHIHYTHHIWIVRYGVLSLHLPCLIHGSSFYLSPNREEKCLETCLNWVFQWYFMKFSNQSLPFLKWGVILMIV